MRTLRPIAFTALLLSAAACHADDTPRAAMAEQGDAAAAADSGIQASHVVVYKSPSCGCCSSWVEHLRHQGFEVEVHDVDNLQSIKERVGLPYGLGACHTAEVGGYFIEGHVPAAEVRKLLQEKPAAKGLTVPGMPIGSPGMEQGERVQAYDVILVRNDGSTEVFAHYPDVK